MALLSSLYLTSSPRQRVRQTSPNRQINLILHSCGSACCMPEIDCTGLLDTYISIFKPNLSDLMLLVTACHTQCGPNSLCTGALDANASYVCSCQPGYASLSSICSIRNGCASGNGGCSQICTPLNPAGPYICSCNAGYALKQDEKTRAPLASPSVKLPTTLSNGNSTSVPSSTHPPTSTHPQTSSPSLISMHSYSDEIG